MVEVARVAWSFARLKMLDRNLQDEITKRCLQPGELLGAEQKGAAVLEGALVCFSTSELYFEARAPLYMGGGAASFCTI